MKPRWLLLAVSVICLLVLAPASALSVGGWPVGCGTAKIDGVLGADEWEPATVLPMAAGWYMPSPEPSEDGKGGSQVAAAQNGEVSANLLLMNDDTHFYVGAEMRLPWEVDPEQWYTHMEVCFTDEGDPLDGKWASPFCPSHEGCYDIEMGVDGFTVEIEEEWEPFREADDCWDNQCQDEPMGPGVAWAAVGDETIVVEWALDLEDSYLDKVGPGDCFLFSAADFDGLLDENAADGGEAWWPNNDPEGDGACSQPELYGAVCLNECEPDVVVEEFVPEPATIMLMGSGLLGLAGYASLRLRKK